MQTVKTWYRPKLFNTRTLGQSMEYNERYAICHMYSTYITLQDSVTIIQCAEIYTNELFTAVLNLHDLLMNS